MQALRGHTSGLAVPYYVIDAPGGGGKVPLLPATVIQMDERQVIVRNYEGKLFRYPLPQDEPAVKPCR
jgi:lysine 2,3-aminomutase